MHSRTNDVQRCGRSKSGIKWYKEGIIVVASAMRSVGTIDSRLWFIDGQVHALIQLPRATGVRQNADNRGRLFAIAAAAVS